MENNLNLIETMFKDFEASADVMRDGMLDVKRYNSAKFKILWVLKQEYYDSGAFEVTYSNRIIKCITDNNVNSTSTWKRMSYVSYGILTGERDFDLWNANICADKFLATAVIEANKELGNSQSPDDVIIDGFKRYEKLIHLQIDTYKPDIIIVCLPESLRGVVNSLYSHCHNSDFENGLENVYIDGADVGISKDYKPLFLWPYHPQATKGYNGEGISDKAYTMSLLRAYDNAMKKNI